MRVVKGFFYGEFFEDLMNVKTISPEGNKVLLEGIAINSKANIQKSKVATKQWEVLGNNTEAALLIMMQKDFDTDYTSYRHEFQEKKLIHKMFTFSSEKKRMTTIVRKAEMETYRVHTKGASEWVLKLCTTYLDKDGCIQPITESKREEFESAIVGMATNGLRTICICYKDVDLESMPYDDQEAVETDMICTAIVGIEDPLRPEVTSAVAQCKKSGIFVRMVTGDNILTAKNIAKQCGIYKEGDIAIEGPEFRKLSQDEIDKILPKLTVMARSSPTDKYKLVKRLRELGDVVAVTGDGTNDAAALNEADIGLAMGLTGTQVAKEASDIVILDDNFNSIVKAVMWGRSVFENIRKFLVFQLTVNFVALVITIVAAITAFFVPGHYIIENGQIKMAPPLAAIQLLWVNLIMDTFAALALATEPPVKSLLDNKPHGRTEPLINKKMAFQLGIQVIYQLICLFVIHFGFLTWGVTENIEQNNTLLFNTFVFCQIFNEFSCRKINFGK